MPTPLTPMDSMRPIAFRDALLRLQGLIGAEISVSINSYERFFGCGLAGRLDRVDTFPPDDEAIKIVLDNDQGLFVDPADTSAFASQPGEADMLELRLACGLSVTVETADH